MLSSPHSCGSWARTSIHPVQSVNSGLESLATSPAIPNISTIYICQSDSGTGMARTSDWVQEQSTNDQTAASEAVAHNAEPMTPPSRNVTCIDNHQDSRPHTATPALSKARSKFIYSIPTLLNMRHLQGAVPVMLRVKPEAIAENIFQYMGAASTRRLPSRSRGLSDISNLSRGSIPSNNLDRSSIGSRFASIPKLNRQPPPIGIPPPLPPQDGFVRFLQQHASPPHHRVTAGGRIVPAGPTSPPPMFDYGSLTGLVRGRLANAETAQNPGQSVLSALKQQHGQAQGIPSLPPSHINGYASIQGSTFAGQPSYLAETMQKAACNDTQYGYQPLVRPMIQTPSTLVPVAVFPDGSTLVSCNGTHYRTYWNGLSTVMEPVQYLQQPTDQQSFADKQQTASAVSQSSFLSHPAQASRTSGLLRNITNDSRASSNRKTSDSLLDSHVIARETAFKQELTNLDKHMALYHFEITPVERSQLVAQRRYLVESLDRIRVSKERDDRSIPIIAPDTGLPITPPTMSTTTEKVDVPVAEIQNKSISKALSPAAPPFVPKLTWSGPYGLPEKRTFSDQSTQYGEPTANQRATHSETNLNLKDMANAAIARKVQNNYNLSGSTQMTSHRHGSSSSVLDRSDPAMRVIEHEDIEYAGRYLYNWGLAKKTYCTTVAEFQEAVRQVRDQARRYGCFGGSSKDPAYDAEQDIWWAICDRDPIPLPTEVPDHVSNPRPWDWEDSAFNFRRKDAPLPPLTIDDARNSPRLSGWDPTMTESMKDRMDVTRSYYAFKGQLPATPFRTWAYDNTGNKIQISDPHSLDHDRFKASVNGGKTSSNLPHSSLPSLPCKNTAVITHQHTGQAPAQTLRPLNTNEINSRHMNTRYKDGRKMNKTEGDAVPRSTLDKTQPVITPYRSSPKVQHVPTPRSVFPGRDTATKPERVTKAVAFDQAYVEDCPETPTKQRSVASVSLGPSPIKTTSPGVTRGSGSKTKDRPALAAVPIETLPRDFLSTSQSSGLDLATDHDGVGQYPIHEKRNPSLTDFVKNARPAVGPFELCAETRSPWGPDEGCSFDPHSPALLANLEAQGTDKGAKVNIPAGAPNPLAAAGSRNAPGVKAANVSSLGNSHQFLRKMLKSPTYASAQPSKPIAATTFGLADRLSKLLRGGVDGATRGSNKENASSNEKARDAGSKPNLKDRDQSDAVLLFKSEPDASVSKTFSSLASIPYQIHAHRPQCDGVETASTAPLYQYQGEESSSQQVRVNLPTCDSYAGLQASDPSDCQDREKVGKCISESMCPTPVGCGFDGGTDSQPATGGGASETTSRSHPNFDYKGVTEADYEVRRESTDNEWHRGAVEDFFQEIATNERQEIASEKQSRATGTRTS